MADQAQLLHAGGFAFDLDGVIIPFTTATPSFNNNMATVTDSTDYVADRNRVFQSRRPQVLESEVEIEFNFRLDKTLTHVLAKLFAGDAALPVVMTSERTDPTTDFLYGNFWISEAELEINVAEDAIITGSATLQSEGEFDLTPLA